MARALVVVCHVKAAKAGMAAEWKAAVTALVVTVEFNIYISILVFTPFGVKWQAYGVA